MADPLDLAVRPLRRVEFDKLVELGAFEGERIELLDGRLVRMSPIGPPHSSTIDKLTAWWVPRLAGRALVRVQNPFAALEVSEPQPDLAIVPLGNYETDHPSGADLIIEVAESLLDYDRGSKLRVYADCGVPEYWIVNLVEHCVEVYRKPGGGRYWQVQRHDAAAVISAERYPDLELTVASVLPITR
ncbi:MAG TPA: Uma2 family endonuclease [Polyangiaceae bacterium]|nr:Uma2 family endonuclease [Polyangiaceae bacterium]